MNAKEAYDDQVKKAHTFIEKNISKHQVIRLLHGFPTHRLWLEKNVPVKEIMAQWGRQAEKKPKRLSLYVATPYCIRTDPEACGYCLFPIEVFTGMKQLDTYLHYLERESRMYEEFFRDVEVVSIYFGGGTSNLYKVEQYPRLMEIVRRMFPHIDPMATITLEGIPQLYTREKIEVMKELGINRISMGVQQMDDELNKLSGRRQKVEHTLQTIEWCQDLGLQCNADLIYGWPRQTCDSMLEGLERLIQTGISYITHYELNIGGASDFALNRRDELPSVEENLEMYRASKQLLEENGFHQLTPCNFEKPTSKAAECYAYEECGRGYDLDLWGWGYAGVSYFSGTLELPGWTYGNFRNVKDYFSAIDQGRFPIERGFHYQAPDLKMNTLFRNLQGLEVDLTDYNTFFQADLLAEYGPIWQALAERGWVKITPEKIRLVGDGAYYTPLVLALLSSARMEELKNIYFSKRARAQISNEIAQLK